MNKKELIFYMCYGFQNAIHNTVRGIAYNYSKSTIRVDVYYDSEPLKDNYDIMSLAQTYVEANMPEIKAEELNLIECHDKYLNPKFNNKEWFYRKDKSQLNY